MEEINFQFLTVFLVGLQPFKYRFKYHAYKCILRGRKNSIASHCKKKDFFDFNLIASKQLKNVLFILSTS